MKLPKIYLETTMFNYYFDSNRDAHADTVRVFNDIKAGKYEAYTSTYVVDELENAPEPKRANMLKLIREYGLTILEASDDAVILANKYIENGIVPQKYKTDALHIALTSTNDLNIIFSLNFHHIVKRKTKLETNPINLANGYKPIEILSPMEV